MGSCLNPILPEESVARAEIEKKANAFGHAVLVSRPEIVSASAVSRLAAEIGNGKMTGLIPEGLSLPAAATGVLDAYVYRSHGYHNVYWQS